MNAARLGAQSGSTTNALRNRRPSAAIRSMFGVSNEGKRALWPRGRRSRAQADGKSDCREKASCHEIRAAEFHGTSHNVAVRARDDQPSSHRRGGSAAAFNPPETISRLSPRGSVPILFVIPMKLF